MTREKQERRLVKSVDAIMWMPHRIVCVEKWTDKHVFHVAKITVHAGGRYFILDEIPGNASSMDIEVDGKKMWITTQEYSNRLFEIHTKLLNEYDSNNK